MVFGFLKKKKPPEYRYGRFEEADFNKLQEGLVKKVGRMEAEKIKLHQKMIKQEEEKKKLSDKVTQISKEKVHYSPFIKRKSLSFYDLLNFSRKKKEIRVLTRDSQYAGKLKDIIMTNIGNTYMFDIVTEVKDKKGSKSDKVIMRHDNFSEMFHNPLGFIDAVRNGVLIINRMSNGQFVPDLIYDDGRNIDEVIGELYENQDRLEGMASREKAKANEERIRRQLEMLGIESNKKITDITNAILASNLQGVGELVTQLGKTKLKDTEQESRIDMLKKNAEIANQNIENLTKRLTDETKRSEYQRIRDEIKENMETVTEQLNRALDLATPRNVTLVQEKKPEQSKKEDKKINSKGKTMHKIRGKVGI